MSILVERHGAKNKFTNPDMDIWQRGTTFATMSDGDYFSDSFLYNKVGAMVHTSSRDGSLPTFAQSGHLSNYSIKIDCTTVDSSIAVGDYAIIGQIIEGYNFKDLAQKQFTLSFWVKATKTGTYCVAFRNGTGDRSYVAEYSINISDTWEKKNISVSASPSTGTWDYTNGKGLIVNWILACGSTFHTTKDAWQTGNYIATSSQVNACDSTNNNFFLSQVQIGLGSVATKFETRHYAEELALCQRYCWVILSDDSGMYVLHALAHSTTNAYGVLYLPVQMRTTPLLTVTTSDWRVYHPSAGTLTPSALVIYNGNDMVLLIRIGVTSGLSSGNVHHLRSNATAKRMIFSAEL